MAHQQKTSPRFIGGALCCFGAVILSTLLVATSPIGSRSDELELIAAALGKDTLTPELDRIAGSIQHKPTELDLIAAALGMDDGSWRNRGELDRISQAVGVQTTLAPINTPPENVRPTPLPPSVPRQPDPALVPTTLFPTASPLTTTLRPSVSPTRRRPVPQPVPQPIPQPVPQPIPQPVPQPFSQPRPDNDTCQEAEVLKALKTRTNEGASIDSTPRCNGESIDGPGVWFTTDGSTGDRHRVHTCTDTTDFDTKITVYRGSCSNLICVTANDDHDDERFCSTDTDSHVTWDIESGETYYILVHGRNSEDVGRFSIRQIRSRAPPVPDNNTCRQAEQIRNLLDRTKTNDRASIDDAPRCNGESVRGPGVWFTRDGSSGDRFTVNTCSSITKFDSKISVYRGSCSRLVCVTANDDRDDESSCSEVTWDTESGETYYILVMSSGASD